MGVPFDRDRLLRLVTAEDGAWTLDLHTGTMTPDGVSWRALGYDPSAPGLPAWGSLVHPEDEQIAWDAVNAGINSGTLPPFAVRLRQADGTWRRVLGRGLVLERGADGTPTVLAGFHSFSAPLGAVQADDPQRDALLHALPDVLAVLYRDCTLLAVHAGGHDGLRAAFEARRPAGS